MYIQPNSLTAVQSSGNTANTCSVKLTWTFGSQKTELIQIRVVNLDGSVLSIPDLKINDNEPTSTEISGVSILSPSEIWLYPCLLDENKAPEQTIPDEQGMLQSYESFGVAVRFNPRNEGAPPPPEDSFCKSTPKVWVSFVSPGIFDIHWDGGENYSKYDLIYSLDGNETTLFDVQDNPYRVQNVLDNQVIRCRVQGFRTWYRGKCHSEWGSAEYKVEENQGYDRPVFSGQASIACVTRDKDHMQAFAVDKNGTCYRSYWHGGPWSQWHVLGGADFPPGAPIATISRKKDLMDLFAVGRDGRPYQASWDDQWHGWQAIGEDIFEPGTPLAVMSRNQHHLEVYGVGRDGVVHARWFWKEWKDWFVIDGERFAPGAPLATASRDDKHMHLWVVGEDGQVRGNAWSNGWKGWNNLGGPEFPRRGWLAALSRQKNLMELWGIDTNGFAHGRWYDGQWHDWYQLGEDSIFRPGAQIAALGDQYRMRLAAHTMDKYLVTNEFAVYKNRGAPFWSGWQFVYEGRTRPKLLPSLAMMSRNKRIIDILGIGESDATVTGSFLAITNNWVHYQIP